MCLDWLRARICEEPDKDIIEPDIVGSIDYNEMYTLLKSEYGNDVAIFLPDNIYELATTESFIEFIKNDATDMYKYTGDPGMDCDDYAAILHGNSSIPKWVTVPIGTVWLSNPPHAVNIFVDENKVPYIVEPQNDSIFRIGDKKDWKARVIWF